MRINRKFSLLVQWQSICFASNLPEKRQNLSSSICKLSYLQLPQVVCLEFAVLCTVVYLLTVETMWHIPSRNIKYTDADSIHSNQKFITYLKELKFIRLIRNETSLDLKQRTVALFLSIQCLVEYKLRVFVFMCNESSMID